MIPDRPVSPPGIHAVFDIRRHTLVLMDVAALAAGALTATAFAPFSYWPMAFIGPALLFLLWRAATPARAAWRGALFSFGLFGIGVWWLYIALVSFGGMPAALAVLALIFFFAYLALYLALAGYVQARWLHASILVRMLVVLPALWVAAEWLRGWVMTGFPWLQLSATQLVTPLAGFAPLLGPYGVSLMTAMVVGALVLIAAERRFVPGIAALAAIALSGFLLGRVDWVQPAGPAISVALVQGNVPLQEKWLASERPRIIERYIALTRAVPDVELVVWPETAVPGWRSDFEATYGAALAQLAHDRGLDLLMGVPEASEPGRTYFNSALSLRAADGERHVYRKRHLVPFGEFLPARPLFGWLLAYLDIPLSDFSRGLRDQAPIMLAGQPVAVSICYEFAFPHELRADAERATFLVNLSEDAWYGNSGAAGQHNVMTRLLALSLGRPVARATNTGVTALMDHRGHVQAQASTWRRQVLVGELTPMRGRTPFVIFGNAPVIALCVALLAGIGVVLARRGRGA